MSRLLSREQALADIRKNWFPEHEATHYKIDKFGPHEDVEVLTWRKPGTSTFYVQYITIGHRLIVTGDIGEAVYGWSQKVTLAWVAGCNYDYIHGKCQASEGGRSSQWNEWSPDEVKQSIKEAVEEDEELSDDHAAVISAYSYADCQEEWVQFLSSREAQAVFGSDAWERASDGEVLPIRLLGHVEGLKMAMKQLEDRE